MTNKAQIVRTEAGHDSATLRLWVDDERGEHLCVCEVEISLGRLIIMATEIDRVRGDAAQAALFELSD